MLKTLQLSWLISCKRLDSELLIIYQRSERYVTLINAQTHYMHFNIKNRFFISNMRASALSDTWPINLFVSLSSPHFDVIGLCEKVDTTSVDTVTSCDMSCLLIANGCLGNWKLYWVIKRHAWDSKPNRGGLFNWLYLFHWKTSFDTKYFVNLPKSNPFDTCMFWQALRW